MVMGRKQCLRTKELRVADVLYDRPGDGQAIEGTRTAADLIEDKKTVLCGVSQDIRHLRHLNHKRTLSGSQISEAPTLVKILSQIPMFASSAGTKLPICAMRTMRAVCLI